MKINPNSVLTYCTNIHPGNTWQETIESFQENIPQVRNLLGVDELAIGLRMGKLPLDELLENDTLSQFKKWLDDNSFFVRSINGFPYGDFHNTSVKEAVHNPDWTKDERVNYTIDLVQVLAELLPKGTSGGISSSPLTYRHWHNNEDLDHVFSVCAHNLIKVLKHLHHLYETSGIEIHIDIEPEPDGLLETSDEFIIFFKEYLVPTAIKEFEKDFSINEKEIIASVKRHFSVCFDVCHFAVVFEDIEQAIDNFKKEGIRIGRIQISVALEARSNNDLKQMLRLNESTYLHQVAVKQGNKITRYLDLDKNIPDLPNGAVARTHFHVPIFEEKYQYLYATQNEIITTLKRWKESPFTQILEVETYTFDVLDKSQRMELCPSIARELTWVKNILSDTSLVK